jgi:hypothetical protein
MKKMMALVLVAGLASAASANEIVGTATVSGFIPLSQMGNGTVNPQVVDPNARYSNITGFSGNAFAPGASALQGTNTITRMMMDDLTPVGVAPGERVTAVRFTVFNANTVPVSARARIRFWNADGAGGGPGTYFNGNVGSGAPGPIGFSFNPLSFGPGVTTLTGTFAGAEWTMPTGRFWAGLTFDNNSTGDQTALFNNMGQGIFNPVDLGSSTRDFFLTNAAGSFFAPNNPAGALTNFGADPQPAGNFGWEFVVPAPGSVALIGLAGLMAGRRRR